MSAINKINVDNVSYNIEDSRVDNIADAIPTASTEQKGLVQIGQGINVDENGVISVEAQESGITELQVQPQAITGTIIGTISWTDENGQSQDVDIYAPTVSYTDSISGTQTLGVINVGDNHYPITYTPAASGDSVQFNSLLASGTQIGTITINGVDTAIYAPSGGSGGGSTVSYQDLTSSTDARVAVGMITIDGAGYNIYVPTLTSVDWNDITGIPIDITKSLSVTPTLASGTKIADVAWYDDEQGSVTADLYAPEQVQANWNEADSSSKAYIANKPTIPTATSQLTNDSNFVSGQNLAAVATTGDYNDLTNKPTIPAVIGDVSGLAVTPDLSSGTKIATIAWTDGSGANTQDLYAPAGGGSSVEPHFECDIAYDDSQNAWVVNNLEYVGPAVSEETLVDWISNTNVQTALRNLAVIKYLNQLDEQCYASGVCRIRDNNTLIIDLPQPLYLPMGESGTTWKLGMIFSQINWDENYGISFDAYPMTGTSFAKVEPILQTGTPIASINVETEEDGLATTIYAPNPGDTVTVTQTLASGTKIADINVSGTTTSLYAPEGGSSGSTDWANVTGNKPYLYQGYKLTSVQQSPTQYTPSTLPGYGTAATGDYSIAIGYDTQATNHCSLAVGGSTRSRGMWSVATGDGTIAAGDRQIAAGTYNAEDSNNYFAFMVGNGNFNGGATVRKNAEATAWNGNKYIEGNLYVGCTDWATVNSSSSGTGKPELVTENAGGKRVLTEDDISSVAGDTVTVTPTLATGTKIAEIDVSGTTTDIYAPAGGATDWADITNKPDITPVAGRDGINNIAGLGGSVNQSQGVNPKGTIVIGDSARSSADNAVALGAGATVTGLNGAAIGWSAQAGRDSVALGTGSQASSYGAALGWTAVARSQYQTAIGANNIVDANGQFGLIVGNGITPDGSILPSSDAMAIGFDGTQYLAGDLYVNCTDFTTTDVGGGELNTANCGGTKVATLSDIKADWAINNANTSGYIANKPGISKGSGTSAVRTYDNVALGDYSFATGVNTQAYGGVSFVCGQGCSAYGFAQHAQGKFNVDDRNNVFADIIGNGTNGGNRKNAEATDWNGNKYLSGGIYVGCTDYTTTANGLTTLGAGGFRIDQAPDSICPDPVSEYDGDGAYERVVGVFADQVTKYAEWNYGPETGDPTDYSISTSHDRVWVPLPNAQKELKEFEVETGLNTGNYVPGFASLGINGVWQLQAVVSMVQDPNDLTQLIPDIENPMFIWKFVSADTSAWDQTPEEEPTPEEPDPENPEEEPTE